MASAGSGDRPPLPDTNDPFVLLGIERDADERTLRRAYARLIRVYRPDRAPVEFQRIHAAFESVRWRLGATLEPPREALWPLPESEPPSHEEVPPQPELVEPQSPKNARVLAELIAANEALQGGDLPRAAELVDALLDGAPGLEAVIDGPDFQLLLAQHPTLSWSRLRRHFDDVAIVHALWDLAWDHAFAREPARALRLLDDPRLQDDAAGDLQLASRCLRRLRAVAWTHWSGVLEVLARYRDALPIRAYYDAQLEQAELEVWVAKDLRTRLDGDWIEELVQLLIATSIGSPQNRRECALRLHARLANEPDALLAQLRRATDLQRLMDLLYRRAPEERCRLDHLPKSAVAHLGKRLREDGRGKNWMVSGFLAIAAAIVCFPFSWYMTVAIIVMLVGFIATDGRRYEREIRPLLARTIVAEPVASEVIVRWIRLNTTLGQPLSRFDLAIDRDVALRLWSLLAVFVFDELS